MNQPPTGVYHPRPPRDSPLYALVADHFDRFEQIYDDVYRQQYGLWRPVIREVVDKYLDCGDVRCGFARVRCTSCTHEFVLAFSCKGRYFCPSCHQKRVLQFAEWVTQEVLQPVPHSQYVFTIPKMLRPYFKHDRKLLGVLSQCAWETLRQYFQAAVPQTPARPGVIVSIQTYGRTCNYHPHLHLLVSDGVFDPQGVFYPLPYADTQQLEALFRHPVLQRLVALDKITSAGVELLLSWKHSGFNVHRGRQVQPGDVAGQETLAAYVLHAPMGQQRLHYDAATATVHYHSPAPPSAWPYSVHDASVKSEETFTALDWLAALTSHIPNKGEQTVRYYGYYSNKSRGLRQHSGRGNDCPAQATAQPSEATAVVQPEQEEFRKACRQNWARLIKKVYEIDPLVCPRCQGPMEIISFIEDPRVIKSILVHLKLWDLPARPPPAGISPADSLADYRLFNGLPR